MSQPSIFSQIIAGDIPCHRIYEDDKTLAFLDINPVAEGHCLVIPKTEVEFVWDLPADDYQALMATTQKVAQRLRDIIGKPYVGEMVVGTDVPHAHVHLIPFTEVKEMKRNLDAHSSEPDHTALAALAAKLAF